MKLIQFIQILIMFSNLAKSDEDQNYVNLEINQTHIPQTTGSIVFESNQNNLSKINSINYQLVRKAFIMESFSGGEIKNLVFMQSQNFQTQIVYCVCQLQQYNLSYFINCIDGIKDFENEIQLEYKQNAKKYQIDLQSEINEKCDKLFIDSDNQLIVLCYTSNKLKIHKINLSKQSTILLKETENFDLIDCQNKFINFQQFTMLVFYNCKNWKLIKLTKDNLITIMNKDLIKEFDQFNAENLQYLTEISFCQDNIIFIEFSNYYVFEFLEDKFYFTSQNTNELNIKQIQFSKDCDIIYYIVYDNSQNNTDIIFIKEQKQVKINPKLNYDIFATNQHIFIRKDKQLQVLICQFLNQTYSIQQSKMNFIDYPLKLFKTEILFPNFFYQIDEAKSIVTFYQYFDLPKSIKPTQKYLFSFQKFNIFTDLNTYDYQIQIAQYRNPIQNQNRNLEVEVEAKNDCSLINQVQMQKLDLGMFGNFEIFVQSESNKFILGITDEQVFSQLFPQINHLNLKNLIHIDYFDYKNLAKIIFSENNLINIYNSYENKILYQYRLENSKIFYYDWFIAIINLKLNTFEILMPASDENYLKYFTSFNQSIVDVKQSQNYLIIKFIDNTFCIYLIKTQQKVYVYDEINKYGVPNYYMYQNSQQFIFFDNFILIGKPLKSKIISIKNAIIFHVSTFNGVTLIKTIHTSDDKIIIYLYDGNRLLKDYEYIVTNTKFIRPLIFKSEKNYISIACLDNDIKNILTFFVNDYIYLINIKLCSNFNFAVTFHYLIYFNLNNILKIVNLRYVNVTFKNPKEQFNYYDQYEFKFQIDQLQPLQQNLNVFVFNLCYQIFPVQKVIRLQNIEQMNIDSLFIGPLTKIKNLNENQIKILGPINCQEKVQVCNLQGQSELCLINFQIFSNSTYPYFSFKQIQGLFYEVEEIIQANISFKTYQINDQNQLINIVLVNDINYLHVFTIDNLNYQLTEIYFQQIKETKHNICKLYTKNKNSLFLLSCNSNIYKEFSILYYQDQKYSFYPNEQKKVIFDACPIENTDQQYVLILNNLKSNGYQLELNFYSFKNQEKQLFLTLEFDREFRDLMKKYKLFFVNFYQSEKYFVKCVSQQDIFEVNLFLIFPDYSCELSIIYNKETKLKQYKLLKIIRNPFSKNHPTIEYIDSQYLILSSSDGKQYLYNIKNDKQFYDYFTDIQQAQILKQINTTHYLFKSINEYFIGYLGYKFELENEYNQQIEKINIIAENQVSSTELEIILEQTNIQYKIQYPNIIIVLFFILIIIYLLRRRKLKYNQQIKNQVNQDTSNIDSNFNQTFEIINFNK